MTRFGIALRLRDAAVEPERLVAEPRHEIQRVRDQQHGAAAASEIGKLVEALVRERFVADREHFVDEQHVRIDVDRDGEPEAHVHARRIRLDRRVDELLELGETDDVVEAAGDLAAAQAEHHAVDVDVLASGDLRVEAGAELDERRHASVDAHGARRRLADAGNQFQHRALARAVAADDSERLARRHVERHALERLEHRVGPEIAQDAARQQRALQRRKLLPPAVTAIDLVHVADFDRVHNGRLATLVILPPPAYPSTDRTRSTRRQTPRAKPRRPQAAGYPA